MQHTKQADARTRHGDSPVGSEWMSPRDVEEMLHLSHTTAWRVCRRLPHVRVGQRCIRVARQDVVDALREGRL